MDDTLDREIQRNLFAFLPKLPDLLPEHEGSFAVLRDQQISSIHKLLSAALKEAHSKFDDGIFSIQRVTARPQELGMFSSANNQG
ncbi:MAG: hypothetical protein AAF250_05940 [Pseudomonadota bacterium]